MQVQCPHCKSRYRLGSEMIDAYGGFVRCGNCNYKFNVHDQVLIEDPDNELAAPGVDAIGIGNPTEAGDTRVEPRLERDKEEDELNIRFRPDGSEFEDDEPVSLEDLYEPRLDPDAEFYGESGDSQDTSPVEDFSFPDSMEALEVPVDDEFGAALDELTEQLLDEDILGEAGDYQSKIEPVLFDSLEEGPEPEEVDTLTLLNGEFDEEPPHTGFLAELFSLLWSGLRFLFWSAIAVALAYLLFKQLKETTYPAYKNHPVMQQLSATGCTFLPCGDASYAVDLYEIVVSRMDEVVVDGKRQLHVSIFLLNKAKQSQFYPNILLTLKTIDGTTVGQRVIPAQEYLTSHDSLISSSVTATQQTRPLVKPNKLGKILIKLDKPPADAVGFEARVVE